MKAKRLRLSSTLLFHLFRGDHPYGFRVIKDAVPEDAVLISLAKTGNDVIDMLIGSDSFEFTPAKHYEDFPLLQPVIERIDPGKET